MSLNKRLYTIYIYFNRKYKIFEVLYYNNKVIITKSIKTIN